MKPTRIEIQFLGFLYRISKSVAFNIAMIVLGFATGFVSLVLHYHYVYVMNSNNEFIPKLEQKLKDLEKMDMEYTEKEQEIKELLKEIKMKLVVEDSCLSIPKLK